ncbi:MAG: NAD-dependent epimerase/dehydratase family protein [Phycisphaerae bacterium]|nr:NAD-dependent epimerase/dehydratase family protein [Phycisphaerae bacterium]
MHNAKCTCWNCPAIDLAGKVDFRACGQSTKQFVKAADDTEETRIMGECKRRPELGLFDPMDMTFAECTEYAPGPYGYMLRDMRVMILGIDGYLGWTLALWLGSLGCKVSGVDNYNRREWVKERGAQTIVPISRMNERLRAAREVLGLNIDFRQIDIYSERDRFKEFVDEVKPESIVHYAECPSAPFSMIDVEHAIKVQENNVLGTLATLFTMRDVVPETSMVKLGTMGEYGTPLTGRPIFEGLFPADAVLQWEGREWSLGGEIVPRDPASFYHVSKVQDTFNCYEACKYWWLRSYDVMQGVIFGVDTDQVSADPRLRTRLDIDEWFGTVINRFVAQAVAGIPLTLYGMGRQIRGFIALRDAMECMTRLICSPPEPGQYAVVNQVSGIYSTRELAYIVAKTGREHFGLDVQIQRVENPRVEADEHPFEAIYERLPKEFGFAPQVALEDEVRKMFELFLTDEVRARIEERRQVIMPKTWWSGVKREVERLELLDLQGEIEEDERMFKINR